MTKQELLSLSQNPNLIMTKEQVSESLSYFADDAKSGDNRLIDLFLSLHDRILSSDNSFHTSEKLHSINQTYLQNSANGSNFPTKIKAFLFEKNADFYFSINAYAECARYVNQILELDNIPDDYTLAALANMMGLIKDRSLKKDVMPYVERFAAYTQTGKLTSSRLVTLYTNLIEVYITLDMRDIYEHIRTLQKAIRSKADTVALRSGLDLRILAGDLILSKRPVTNSHLEVFWNIINDALTDSGFMDTSASCLIKVMDVMKDYIDEEDLIQSIIGLIDNCSSNNDRLKLYEYLDEELHISKKTYQKVYNNYYRELKEYRRVHEEFSLKELHNEISYYKQTAEYKKYACQDGMTGLLNRHAYETAIDNIRRGQLDNNLVILLADLNNLKKTNDIYGHKTGDELLIAASYTLKNELHKYGSTYRIGGDEFVGIIYTDTPDSIVEAIKLQLSKHHLPNGESATVSIGYACVSMESGKSIDQLIKLADQRMYIDKEKYHNLL